MPRYTDNVEKNVMIPLDLPSCEGAVIHVPSRLGGKSRAAIQSKAMILREVPYTEQELEEARQTDVELEPRFESRFDPTAAAAELLVQSCVDTRAYTNLTDKEDRPINLTRAWVETKMDEDDFLHLAQVLFFRSWESIDGAAPPPGEAEEGDGPLDSDETSPVTTDTDGSQPTNTEKSSLSEKSPSRKRRAARP